MAIQETALAQEGVRPNDAVRNLERLGVHLDCLSLLSQTELTPREVQISDLIMRGFPNPQIARRLNITTSTLRTHIKRVYRKAGVHSKSELILQLIARLADAREREKGV